MDFGKYGDKFTGNPIGRASLLLLGFAVTFGVYAEYPAIESVLSWSVPVLSILWGGSSLYTREGEDHLTLIAGCILIAGGISYGLYLSVPMGEMAGMIAISLVGVGILVELFASHYRNRESDTDT